MFDLGLLSTLRSAPKATKREGTTDPVREAVNATVRGLVENGTYTYTEHHLAPEPYRTMGFQYLDGQKNDGDGKPVSEGAPENWDNGHRFLLVSLDPSKGIRYGIVKDRKIPGTNRIKREKLPHDFGSIAEIPDAPGHRWARQIIFQQAWPVLQTLGTRETASCVEWNWLAKAANEEDPAPGVVELYNELLPRVEAYLTAKSAGIGTKTTEAPKRGPGRPKNTNETKSPGNTPAGV